MEAQGTPNLIAGGNINPFRFVISSTAADNTGLQASAATTTVLGVSAGDTKRFDATLHAETGDPISLQNGRVWLVEAGGSITRGARLTSNGSGQAIATTTAGNYFHGIALESAASGAIIRMYATGGTVA